MSYSPHFIDDMIGMRGHAYIKTALSQKARKSASRQTSIAKLLGIQVVTRRYITCDSQADTCAQVYRGIRSNFGKMHFPEAAGDAPIN